MLTPLGAIDLDQGDNSTQVNDNNGTDFKDLNDTIIADDDANHDGDANHDENDMEIKSDNKNDVKNDVKNDLKTDVKTDNKNDLKTDVKNDDKNDLKTDVKNDDKNDLKTDVKNDDKKAIDTDLTVETKDIVLQGDNLSVEIHANKLFTGDVKCKLNSDIHTVHIVNGVGYATIDTHNLSPDYYQICTYYDGDEIFKKDVAYASFIVRGYPNLSIHVDDSHSWNERLHVVVDADKNFNGNATITLNNRVWTNKIEVVNGHGEGYYQGGDFPGNYTAKVATEGNELFLAANSSTTYRVLDS